MSTKDKAIENLEVVLDGDIGQTEAKLVRKAIKLLSTAKDSDPIPFLEEAASMIQGSLGRLLEHLPGYRDAPEEKLRKFAICENELTIIKEFASQGLKARYGGSSEVVTRMLKDHNLQEYQTSRQAPLIEDEEKDKPIVEISVSGPGIEENTVSLTAEQCHRARENLGKAADKLRAASYDDLDDEHKAALQEAIHDRLTEAGLEVR